MKNKITKIQEKVPQITTLPDGFYNGIWSGYIIEISLNGKTYELTTEEGVRGNGIKVVVEVKDGVASFEEINS